MAIERVDDFSPELTEAMKLLVPQLSRSSAPMEEGAIRDFISQPGVYLFIYCLLYTSPSPRDKRQSRMPSSA